MKKALAIFMVLAVATGVAFADVADIAVSGFGQLTWGVNLDEPQVNGFKNSNEWKIVLPLLAKKTFTTKSEGDAYAEISIVDAQYGIEGKHDATGFTAGDKKIDKVEAKLVFGAVYMTVTGAPGFKSNSAEIWAPIKADGYFDDGKEGKDKLRFEPGFDGQGTKIGYKTDKFDVGVKLASKNAYDASASAAVPATVALKVTQAEITVDADNLASSLIIDPTAVIGDVIPAGTVYAEVTAAKAAGVAERKSQYSFGFDASVTPSDMVSASATFNYATWNAVNATSGTPAKPVAGIMSAGFKVTAKPVADLEVIAALDAGNDYMAATKVADAPKQVWAYDALVSAKFKKLVEAGMYYSAVGTPAATNFAKTSGKTADTNVAEMAVYGKVMDGGLVPNLTASATVVAMNLLSEAYYTDGGEQKLAANPLAFGVDVAYKVAMGDVNYVKPFATLYGQGGYDRASKSYKAAKDNEFAMAGTLGADYGLFTNTVITAKYAAGSTQDNAAIALVDPTKAARLTKGIFTLACKVTY